MEKFQALNVQSPIQPKDIMKTQQELIDALLTLGKTEGEIARNLADMGIMGEQQSNTCCPLANFLKSKGFPHPLVGRERIIANAKANFYYYLSNEMGWALRSFIRCFDKGDYPVLIIPSET
jgi:hypothetical protein